MDETENQLQDVWPEQLVKENGGLKKQSAGLITYLKYLAILLFIVLPLMGFWLGVKYQKGLSKTDESQVEDTTETKREEIPSDWNLYQNDEFGFTFRYPREWEISVKDHKGGGNYHFASIAGYEWREPGSALEISVVDPLEYDNRFIVRYMKNELDRTKLKEGDNKYNLQLTGGIEGTVYEFKDAFILGFDGGVDYDVLIARHEGDLLKFSPAEFSPGKFNELYKNIASTISFTSNKNPNPTTPIDITKADLVPYFNNLYKCSSAVEEWQCFDENLNISEKQPGKTPNVSDVTAYKEGRVFTSFSDITGDGYDDATVMIYYKRFSRDTLYKQSVFVLTRDISITGDPERDIFTLYLNEVGTLGQSTSGFNEILPLAPWANGALDIGSPNYPNLTYDRPCSQLVWDDKSKSVNLLRVECK